MNSIIKGTVIASNTKEGLLGVTVTISEPAVGSVKVGVVLTDINGSYIVKPVGSGTYAATFELEGYRTRSLSDISVPDESTVHANAELDPVSTMPTT